MQNYNQVYINEGHLLKALIKANMLEEFVLEEDKKMLLKLGTTSREMVAHLHSPMGVAKSNRVKGIGYSLLHHCLKDMHEMGYEYAIIGGAGPIEFYEQACQAVVIPTTNFKEIRYEYSSSKHYFTNYSETTFFCNF